MLVMLTLLIMLGVGYAYWREGVLFGFCMCVSVLAAGLVAFNFWEPLADLVEGTVQGSTLAGYEDFLCLAALFTITLALMRLGVDVLLPQWMEYPAALHQFGGAALGAIAGYLVSGFLICALETLPWHENFLGFEAYTREELPIRKFMPPDRVWLGLMHYAGAYPLAANELANPNSDERYESYDTFDRFGTFELRYLRHRRYSDQRDTLPYLGEFERETRRTR